VLWLLVLLKLSGSVPAPIPTLGAIAAAIRRTSRRAQEDLGVYYSR